MALQKGAPAAGLPSFLEQPFQYFLSAGTVFPQFSAISRARYRIRQTGLSIAFFLHCAALTLWNRWKDALRECAKAIPLGNFPASRPSGNAARQRGRHRRAASLGSMARRKRRVEPDGVRPSSPGGAQAGARAGARAGALDGHWVAIGWPIGGGGPESGKVPARFFVRFFRGRRLAAAGALRALTKVYIGNEIRSVKDYYRKKGNFLKTVRRTPPHGGCRPEFPSPVSADFSAKPGRCAKRMDTPIPSAALRDFPRFIGGRTIPGGLPVSQRSPLKRAR